MKFSLLDDSLIRVRLLNKKIREVSLPEIYPMLIGDKILGFEALQPHQHQPWFSFLVQLGAMTVARETNGTIPDQTDEWKKALLRLAGNSEAAWHLVVKDVSKPAFLQSPVPEGSLENAGYKSDISTPDELDMLVTSKNHDLKGSRVRNPNPEHWLFALLTLQTMEGFLGRGNYGIVRMNGGFGNRPFVGFAPGFSWGSRVTRDLRVLLRNRHRLTEYYKEDGHALLWNLPWDGKRTSALSLEDCDPFFLEICRRIRFRTNKDNKIICQRTNTEAARIFAVEDLKGRTGDPWTPIEKKGVKALTLGGAGFSYNILQQVLLGEEFSEPISMEIQENEKESMLLITQALIRGQGKTDGLHLRLVPIPSNVYRLFSSTSEKQKLAERSKARVDKAQKMQLKVLGPSISLLLSSGDSKKIDYEKIAPWTERFSRAIDNLFFDSLWESVQKNQLESHKEWDNILFREAEKLLKEAERSTPLSNIRRWKAISQARGRFYGSARRHFDHLFQNKVETSNLA